MTSPGQPPSGPNQPQQPGGAQPTSSYPVAGSGHPAGVPGGGFAQPGQGQPAGGGQSGWRQGPGLFTYVLTIIAAIVAIAVAVFIAQNTHKTEISFFGKHAEVSVSVALVIATGGGFLVGLVLGLIPAYKARRELRQIRRVPR